MKELDRSVGRYVDGEMGRDERVAFEARMREEPALGRVAEEMVTLRGLFAPGRNEAETAPSVDFRRRVLDAVSSAGLPAVVVDVEVEWWARRVILTAAAVLVAAVLVAVGLLGRGVGTGRLEASPAEVQRTMAELDARAGAATAGGAAEAR